MNPNLKVLAGLSLAIHVYTVRAEREHAAPPAPPVVVNKSVSPAAPPIAGAPTQFSIGQPTDEEQLYLELINRARKDPPAEALRYLNITDQVVINAMNFFFVDRAQMAAQISTNLAAPPLSFNAKLTAIARAHSQAQFNIGDQTHFNPGTTEGAAARATAAGYQFKTIGENVYAYAKSVEHGHGGFEVDWGNGPFGMQFPAGHRQNIHNAQFSEVGIGVVNGTNEVIPDKPVGPQLVTQDFARPLQFTPYVTGVAYYDLNGNNFYDVGEGVGGVTVTVDGVEAFAVTAASGGYSVPVQAGNHTVRFKAAGVADSMHAVSVSTSNVKLDYTPAFVPSAVTSGSATAFAGASSPYTVAKLGGATGYDARVFSLRPAAVEGAEGTVTNWGLTTFGGYNPISTTFKASGSQAFHLGLVTDNNGTPANRNDDTSYPQLLTLNERLALKTGATLQFKSMLGVAFTGEVAHVEISIDDGATWEEIWRQRGADDGNGEAVWEQTFSTKTVSLAPYVGHVAKLRFNYFQDGGWYSFSGDPFGWYIDDITVTNAEEAYGPAVTAVNAGGTFGFNAAASGGYALQFRAAVDARRFPWGTFRAIQAGGAAPVYSILNNATVSGSTVTLRVLLSSGSEVTPLIESASAPNGTWNVVTGATVTGPMRGQYTITAPASGNAQFYRVRTP